MKTIQIAVGSLRAPKLDGVRGAIAAVGPMLDADARFEILGMEAASGVRHTPLSREESMVGAQNRAGSLAKLAREREETWEYFVGLEGGLDVVAYNGRRIVFLESWACVLNRSGLAAFGRSGGIEMPEMLAAQVLDAGVELSEAMDAMTGKQGTRNAQGAWGVLTRNAITRQDAFRTAAIAAFAKFFNSSAYLREEH